MSEFIDTGLSEAVTALQLPIPPTLESEVVSSVAAFLAGRGESVTDGILLIADAIDEWQRSDTPSRFLREVFEVAIPDGIGQSSERNLRAGYFEVFRRLRAGTKDWNGLTHTTARRLLSRTPLLLHLLIEEQMSCTQISRLLRSLEVTLDVPYQAIGAVARGLGFLPALDAAAAGLQLRESDSKLSEVLFPDSSLDDTCEIAAQEAMKIIPELDTAALLRKLCQIDDHSGEPFWPYLQILHFCCVPLEFYDHTASFLYEFNPRGQIATQLFDSYPAVTANPILNNAKAVPSLDRAWARNRGGDDAHALVALLEALESLPYVMRRELARIFRAFLQRMIQLATTVPVPLPEDLTAEEVERVITFVAHHETNTKGVLEQRIVDGLAILVFSGDGWRARGLGDSVNASNLARHKFGDVEFANVDRRLSIALEAHGGHLSLAYVRSHQKSLSRIVRQRLDESWLALDEPSNWSIRIIFVAHTRDFGLPSDDVMFGVRVEYDYWDYDQLLASASDNSASLGHDAVIWQYSIDPLNSATTRQSVRNIFLQLCGRDTSAFDL